MQAQWLGDGLSWDLQLIQAPVLATLLVLVGVRLRGLLAKRKDRLERLHLICRLRLSLFLGGHDHRRRQLRNTAALHTPTLSCAP
jgi:hypothetical protein